MTVLHRARSLRTEISVALIESLHLRGDQLSGHARFRRQQLHFRLAQWAVVQHHPAQCLLGPVPPGDPGVLIQLIQFLGSQRGRGFRFPVQARQQFRQHIGFQRLEQIVAGPHLQCLPNQCEIIIAADKHKLC